MSGWGLLEIASAVAVFGTAILLVVVAYDFGDDFARSDRAAARREARSATRGQRESVAGATRRGRAATTTPDRDRDRAPKAQV